MGKDSLTIQLENTKSGSNKFYNMSRNSIYDKEFYVEYGRIGTNGRHVQYPMSQWNKKLTEKINKGYRVVFDDSNEEEENVAMRENPANYLVTDSKESYIDEYNGQGNSLVVIAPSGTKVRVKRLEDDERDKLVNKLLVLVERLSSTSGNASELHDIEFIKKYLESYNVITKKSLERLVEISKNLK